MSVPQSIFAAAERGRRLSPESYEARVPALRSRLLHAQLALRDRKFSVVLIVSGADGAGKGELVHRLNEWLEPRGVATDAFWRPTDEERERPEFWRFWRALPAHGRIGIFFGSWYSLPIVRRVLRDTKKSVFEAELDRATTRSSPAYRFSKPSSTASRPSCSSRAQRAPLQPQPCA